MAIYKKHTCTICVFQGMLKHVFFCAFRFKELLFSLFVLSRHLFACRFFIFSSLYAIQLGLCVRVKKEKKTLFHSLFLVTNTHTHNYKVPFTTVYIRVQFRIEFSERPFLAHQMEPLCNGVIIISFLLLLYTFVEKSTLFTFES